MALALPIDGEANALLQRSPLALLIALVLDQQIPLERAFAAPYDLAQRLGHDPEPAELADFDPEALVEVFAQRPALHRFPKAMARRVQDLCRKIVDDYDGDAGRVWDGVASGDELLKRVAALPGFGDQKARIFVALLGKQAGVRPPGWREAAGEFGDEGVPFGRRHHRRRVAAEGAGTQEGDEGGPLLGRQPVLSPTSSALTAPRSPSGRSGPTVLSW